jgi:fucose permease
MQQQYSSVRQIKLALLACVWAFSSFACTLSTFIMQAVSYFKVSPTSAGTLESYQNLAMVLATFITFSYIIKVGYKYTLISIMLLMTVLCLLFPLLNSYWFVKLYLIGVGIVLVGMKVGIYSCVAFTARHEKDQAQFLSLVEAVWMIASMAGMWIMAYAIRHFGHDWIYSLWYFAAIGVISLVLWLPLKLDEQLLITTTALGKPRQIMQTSWAILRHRLVIAAISMLFIANLVEMGLSAWLPGFYVAAFNLSQGLSVYLASLALFATFAGRLMVAWLLRYFNWQQVLLVFYASGLIFLSLVLFTLVTSPSPINQLSQVPVIAYLLPTVGFFLAPNTPLLNSSILARIAKAKQPLLMTILSIVFAVASSIGARGIGQLIEHCGAVSGFKLATLLPLFLLLVLIFPYARYLQKSFIE